MDRALTVADPRATVCLSLDFDTTSIWFMFGLTGARTLSRGEFGATTDAPRLLGGDLDGAIFEPLVEEGFGWNPGLIGEFWPRWCRGKDTIEGVGAAITPGRPLDLAELPITFLTSDFVHFELDFSKPEVPSRLRNPKDVEDIRRQQLDYLVEHEHGGCLIPAPRRAASPAGGRARVG